MGETKGRQCCVAIIHVYLFSPIREDEEQGRGSDAKLRERYIVYIPLRSSFEHFSCLLVKIFPVPLLSLGLLLEYVCVYAI